VAAFLLEHLSFHHRALLRDSSEPQSLYSVIEPVKRQKSLSTFQMSTTRLNLSSLPPLVLQSYCNTEYRTGRKKNFSPYRELAKQNFMKTEKISQNVILPPPPLEFSATETLVRMAASEA